MADTQLPDPSAGDRPDDRHHLSGPQVQGRRWIAVLPAGLVLIVGVVLLFAQPWAASGRSGSGSANPPGVKVTQTPSTAAAQPGITSSLQVPVAVPKAPAAPGTPVSVTVSRVGISSSLQPLGLEPDGSLQPPSRFEQAGWYAKGIRPGAVGPALIAGHVDSVAGPAVFYRLREVRVGDDIAVRDSLGAIRHFTVTDIQSYPKSKFPTEAVYGPTPLPVLRLVTCTGNFDASKRSYVDNLVVSAELNGTRAP